jgi:hypothetical protein
MSLHFSVLKASHLLSGRCELYYPLLGSGELCGWLAPQPCLLGKAVLGVLLLPKESGFHPTAP